MAAHLLLCMCTSHLGKEVLSHSWAREVEQRNSLTYFGKNSFKNSSTPRFAEQDPGMTVC